jgi:hypothetical protein
MDALTRNGQRGPASGRQNWQPHFCYLLLGKRGARKGDISIYLQDNDWLKPMVSFYEIELSNRRDICQGKHCKFHPQISPCPRAPKSQCAVSPSVCSCLPPGLPCRAAAHAIPNLHWMGGARQRNSSLFALFRLAAARQSLLESEKKGVTRLEAVAPGLAL